MKGKKICTCGGQGGDLGPVFCTLCASAVVSLGEILKATEKGGDSYRSTLFPAITEDEELDL